MSRAALALFVPLALSLCACAGPRPPAADPGPPLPEPMYAPAQVKPGRLEYAPDRSTFAPILTERFPYPTQPEANAAYRRLLASAPPDRAYPASVWLFGCKPGALDAQTARVTRYGGPVVHCATDFLDAGGRRVRCRGATASARRRTSGGGSRAATATSSGLCHADAVWVETVY